MKIGVTMLSVPLVNDVGSRRIVRSHLKKRILVQDQGGAEFQTAGILKYVEDLKRGTNTETCPPPADWAKRLF